MSEIAWEMQRLHESLLRQERPRRIRNRRFKCVCGNRVTANQLRLHDGNCIYCGTKVKRP